MDKLITSCPITLARIIIYADKLEGLKIFYQHHFELALVEEIKNKWVVLRAGTTEIAFHKIGKHYESNVAFKAQSNTKLVFELENSIISKRQKLLDAGVMMKSMKTFGGFPYFYCDGEDFEGNVFQLMQKVEPSDVHLLC